MEILIITGPPYSGKGTQCDVLKKELDYKHLSTGERIREEKKQNTLRAEQMRQYEEQGNLVPDSLMLELIEDLIEENRQELGIILDGYPRTIPQVDALLDMLSEKGLYVSKVVNIEVPSDELLVRAKKRAAESARKDDDDPETHFKRIRIFEEETRPAIEYFKSKIDVITIDGIGEIATITARILAAL